MAKFHDNYGFIDKSLHYLAFKTQKLQLSLAKIETEEYKKELSKITIKKPVFITSLPRSGTTILLNSLSKTEYFTYQTYKDMPFLFTPLKWGAFSEKFKKSDELIERAHNDGIKINQHSPEAFEEVFYKVFWPKAYQSDSLQVWQKTQNLDFNQFFSDYVKKLIYRKQKETNSSDLRYLSKNNQNINRLEYLQHTFPDGVFLVPFRNPIQHAMSLLEQHLNFTKLHQENQFSKDYMAAIGHFDFGINLKPLNFNGWFDLCQYPPDTLDFWLDYWINTFQYILNSDFKNVKLVCFEQLGKNPELSLVALANELDLKPDSLLKWKADIKEVKPRSITGLLVNQTLSEQAELLYDSLFEKSINVASS